MQFITYQFLNTNILFSPPTGASSPQQTGGNRPRNHYHTRKTGEAVQSISNGEKHAGNKLNDTSKTRLLTKTRLSRWKTDYFKNFLYRQFRSKKFQIWKSYKINIALLIHKIWILWKIYWKRYFMTKSKSFFGVSIILSFA